VISLVDLVGDVAAFERGHWGRTPMLRRADLDVHDLLDISAAEQLLIASPRRPAFRLVQDGVTLPPERSTSTVRMGGRALDDVADVAKIADAVSGGTTLVLQGLQRTWPPLIDLCRRLERELSHPVQANAYLTPAGASGLASHTDEHDVLVLQLSGRKAWDIEHLGAITMTQGDVLYLPVGTRHAASAQQDTSLHLTIGILRVTYGQVVRRALGALGDADLDAPLPIGFADPARAGALATALGAAVQRTAAELGAVDAEALAAAEQRRARTWRPPLGAGRLTSALAVDALDGSSAVLAPEDHEVELDDALDADGRLVLHLRDRRLHLPPVARPALERLLAGDVVKVGELPELSDASRLVLARRLVREGWLVVVDA
jgi:hypothetical protein